MAMVAHDELGGLLPIKRTIRVIDAQNQSFREQEVRRSGVLRGRWWLWVPRRRRPPTFPLSAPEERRPPGCAESRSR